jgi:hypothetical protein
MNLGKHLGIYGAEAPAIQPRLFLYTPGEPCSGIRPGGSLQLQWKVSTPGLLNIVTRNVGIVPPYKRAMRQRHEPTRASSIHCENGTTLSNLARRAN